jgi:hypothetical protein
MTGEVERITGASLLREHARGLNAYMHYLSTAPIEDLLAKFDIRGDDLTAWARATRKTVPDDSAQALRDLLIALDVVLDQFATPSEPRHTVLGEPLPEPNSATVNVTVHNAIGWLCAYKSRPGHRDGGLVQAMNDYSHLGPAAWVRYAAALDPEDQTDDGTAFTLAVLRGAHLPQPG